MQLSVCAASLSPLQLGCGTPNGAEAVAHAARLFVHNISDDHLLLNLDFKNAFNYLRRDKMLEVVGESTPDLYAFVYSAYAKPSSLFCGNSVLLSEEGVQQGDPFGPLLFCLTIHPMVMQLRSKLRMFYIWMMDLWVVVCQMSFMICSWWRDWVLIWVCSSNIASQS